MATNYNPGIVTSGLVLCLDAGNTKSYPGSGTTWTDLSGNGNTGTLVNSPSYSSSGYFSFDGTNKSVSIVKPQPNITGQISVEIWYISTLIPLSPF
jgi:hypothetical protein